MIATLERPNRRLLRGTGVAGVAAGAGTWIVSLALRPTLVEALIGFAALVIVPLALRQVPDDSTPMPGRQLVVARRAQPIAAILLVVALALDHGPAAAVVSLPWLAVTALLAGAGAGRLVASRSRLTFAELTLDGALLCSLVAGTAASAATAGWRVLGFAPFWLLLTAAHFHYAGLALGVLTSKARAARPGPVAAAASALWLFGIPVVAVGIARVHEIEWVGVLAVTAAGVLVAALQLSIAHRTVRATAAWFIASSAAVAVGMGLACGYGLASRFGFAWLTIPQMERFHGVTNAFGFALCGLIAWSMNARRTA
jgi:hypothetical protein